MEGGKQDLTTTCWRQYLVPFMLGICVWQRGHEVVFPEWYPVPGDHTVIANSSNGVVHRNC